MRYTVIITGRLAGLNEYTDAQRSNRNVGARLKREDQEKCAWFIKKQLHNVHITKPVRLDYYFYEPNRKRDHDNVSGFAHKVFQDALVQMQVIRDDGWDEIVAYSDSFGVDKRNPRIEVVITEVE